MRSFWIPVAALALFAAIPAHAQDAATTIVHARNNGYRSVVITPSNTPILATSAIFNGNATACNITMQLNGDSGTIVWQNVQPGEVLPIQAVLVTAASTCVNMIAIYDK